MLDIRDSTYCTFEWNDGSTTGVRTVSPTVSTTYAVTVTDIHGCTYSDDIMVGIIHFVLTMFVMIALLVAFPDIALWLPSLFY